MRLLILDDDLGFLFWVAKALAPGGYYIVPADTVAHATRLLRRLKLSIDLLIVNPEVEGAAEFAADLRVENPRLQVVALAEDAAEVGSMEVNARHAKPDLSAVVDLEEANESDEEQAEWLRFVQKVLGHRNAAGSSRTN